MRRSPWLLESVVVGGRRRDSTHHMSSQPSDSTRPKHLAAGHNSTHTSILLVSLSVHHRRPQLHRPLGLASCAWGGRNGAGQRSIRCFFCGGALCWGPMRYGRLRVPSLQNRRTPQISAASATFGLLGLTA